MREQFYKPAEAKDIVTGAELMACKYCRVPIAEPECANIPEGEWYCPNPECVVRECTIRCKLYGEPLPAMACPACGSALRFQHWIGYETLEPVSAPPPLVFRVQPDGTPIC
jgi:hypothetical protein